MNKEKLLNAISRLIPALFRSKPRRWGSQAIKDGKVVYYEQKTALQEEELQRHFGSGRRSISIRLYSKDEPVKCVVLDCDSSKWVELASSSLIPELRRRGADPIFEASANGRAHIWIRVDASLGVCKQFFDSILDSCNLKRDADLEGFPIWKKENNFVRLFGGVHLKSGVRHGFLVDGVEISDPLKMIDIFVNANVLPGEQMQAWSGVVEPVSEQLNEEISRYEQRFLARSLPPPVEGLPKELRKITSNCQAYNSLVRQVEEGRLNEDGTHYFGLHLAGMAMYIDEQKETTESNVDWMKEFIAAHRSSSHAHHNWFNSQDDTERLSANCRTLNDLFDSCGDCPLRGRKDWNPKYFLQEWREVSRVPIPFGAQLLPVSHDDVRDRVFPRIKNLVLDTLGMRFSHEA